MKTLMEFKNIKRSWMNIAFEWSEANSNIQEDETLKWKRDIELRDIEGLAAKIAYSMYKEEHLSKELNLIEELPNEEHLLFINFLKQQGITAQFSYNLKKIKKISIQEFLISLQEKRIDIEWALFFAFQWDFKGIQEDSNFWEYHSNTWQKKLKIFRGN